MRAIKRATVHRDPFPFMIVDDVVPPYIRSLAVKRWPSERMTPEPGGLNRRWADLITADNDQSRELGLFWWWFTARYGKPILRAVFDKFKHECEAKNGARNIWIGQLTCFEAESEFIEHPPHAHWDIGPEWLFTVLIHLDDNGRTDRGTRLYRQKANGDMSTVVDTGFSPGRMLAFFEAQNAYHGSTPFEGGSSGRKMIRAHVLASQSTILPS